MKASLPPGPPALRLYGEVNQSMVDEFFRQQAEASANQPVVVELSTPGGDADFARRIAQEIRQWRCEGGDVYFLGKSFVYSAGITIMGAFERDRRFLSLDCELLIHERRLKMVLHLDGSLKTCATQVKNTLAEIRSGERLELDGFRELVQGTSVSVEEIQARVCDEDWYLPALEAERLGLVAGLHR